MNTRTPDTQSDIYDPRLAVWAKRLERMVIKGIQAVDVARPPGATQFHPTAISKWITTGTGLGKEKIERFFMMNWNIRICLKSPVPGEPYNPLSITTCDADEHDLSELMRWWVVLRQSDTQRSARFLVMPAINALHNDQWFVLVRSGAGRFVLLCDESRRDLLRTLLIDQGYIQHRLDSTIKSQNALTIHPSNLDWMMRGGGVPERVFDELVREQDEKSVRPPVPEGYLSLETIKNPMLRVMLEMERQGITPVEAELLIRAKTCEAIDYSKIQVFA